MRKRVLSALLCVAIIPGILPTLSQNVGAMYDYTWFNQKVAEIKQDYPEGTAWSNENSYPSGWYGCWAFANIMAERIFGCSTPRNSWGTVSIDSVLPGDILRSSSHTMFVIGVSGDNITLAEGNYGANTTAKYIHYDRVTTKAVARSENFTVYHAPNYDDIICEPPSYIKITPGVYTIHSAWDYNKVLDIAGDSKENDANIQLYDFLDNDVQRFRIIECGDFYTIQSVYSALWLDVASPAARSGQNVKLYNRNDSDDERWRFEYVGDGYVYIRNLKGNYLDIAGDSTENHANIQVYGTKASNSQKWKLVSMPEPIAVTPGIYTIHSAWDNNKVLDIAGDSKENRANIQLYDYIGNTVQKFQVVDCGDYYNIRSVYSGYWLDIQSPAYISGNNVQLWLYNNTDDERWIFEDAGDGYVYIRNRYGNYLDIAKDSTANKANIQVFWKKENNSQRWKLVLAGASITAAIDSNRLTYTVTNAPTSALLIAARYDSGKMTDVQTVKVSGNLTDTLTMRCSGNRFKLFLVDGSTYAPLCAEWDSEKA